MTLHTLVMLQYGVTALSSAVNAAYFAHYRSELRRRRIGARVLALASLALALESAYFGLYLFPQRPEADPRAWLVVGALSAVGSLLMSGLILRSVLSRLNYRS